MRREDDGHLAARHVGEGLLDLGRVAVLGHAVGLDGLVGVAVVRARGAAAPGAGDAGDGVGYHEVAGREARGEGGRRGEGRGRGIAARHGHEHGLARGAARGELGKPGAEELRQAVYRASEQLGARVRGGVPVLVDGGVAQAVVGGEVEHGHAALEQRRREREARGVRDGEEGDVRRRGDGVRLGQRKREVAGARKGRVDRVEARAGLLAVRGHGQLEVGMAQDEAAGLDARIARCPHDARPDASHAPTSFSTAFFHALYGAPPRLSTR